MAKADPRSRASAGAHFDCRVFSGLRGVVVGGSTIGGKTTKKNPQISQISQMGRRRKEFLGDSVPLWQILITSGAGVPRPALRGFS